MKHTALTCRLHLEDFLHNIRKFDKNWAPGQPRRNIQNVLGRVQWAFGPRAEADNLRKYLILHIGTLKLRMTQHGLGVLDVALKQGSEEQKELKKSIVDSSTNLRGDLRAQALIAQENQSKISTLIRSVNQDVIIPLRAMMGFVTNVQYGWLHLLASLIS